MKTLERVVFNQVSPFMSKHNLLDANQSGFRRGYSTETAATLSHWMPCELQKLIPNHQFSYCWIYLLLLTLLTIRFSWPSSHHWASQGFHFADLNPISMAGLSRWPGEGRYPQNIHWSLGSWTPPLLHIHYITGSHHTSTWFLIPLLCWWQTALSLILSRSSRRSANYLNWMSRCSRWQ